MWFWRSADCNASCNASIKESKAMSFDLDRYKQNMFTFSSREVPFCNKKYSEREFGHFINYRKHHNQNMIKCKAKEAMHLTYTQCYIHFKQTGKHDETKETTNKDENQPSLSGRGKENCIYWVKRAYAKRFRIFHVPCPIDPKKSWKSIQMFSRNIVNWQTIKPTDKKQSDIDMVT